jgi:HSP20 family protein
MNHNGNALVQKETAEVAKPETTWGGTYFTPRVDIFEDDQGFTFCCDLPGVKPDDVNLRFEKGELQLLGRVTPREHGRYLLNEYGVGDFYRSFTIHEEVDADKIGAELKHGVLTVHVPKKEAVKPRRIAIKAE